MGCPSKKKRRCRKKTSKKKRRFTLINVDPTPVSVNPTINVDPTPVNVNPTLAINPFRKVCTRTNTGTFENLESIAITGDSVATPYPSNILVTNMIGIISKVTVVLFNMNHPTPDEIDILLVHPNGLTNTILMSDAGGSFDINNVTLQFNDDAVNFLPDAAQIVSGTFKPTNYEGIETFPAPAPSSTSGVVALSNFNELPPNGTWQLYVVDDATPLGGSISGGWALNITTTETEECIFTPL
jgi:hypothetical protein